MAMLNNQRVYHVISSKSSPQKTSNHGHGQAAESILQVPEAPRQSQTWRLYGSKGSWQLELCVPRSSYIVVYGHPTRDFLQ